MSYNPSQPEMANGDYPEYNCFTDPSTNNYPSTCNYQWNCPIDNNHSNQGGQPTTQGFMLNEALSFANSRIDTLVNLLNQKETDNRNLIKSVQSLTESNKKLSDQNDLFTSMLSQILKNVQSVQSSTQSNGSETLRFNKKPSTSPPDNDITITTSPDSSHKITTKKPPSPPASSSLKRPNPSSPSSSSTSDSLNKKSSSSSSQQQKKTLPTSTGNEKSSPLKRSISSTTSTTSTTSTPKLRKVV
jgi:hypothetical protein